LQSGRSHPALLILLGLLAASVVGVLVWLNRPAPSPQPPPSCTGVDLEPGDDIEEAVDAIDQDGDATFCLAAGTFSVKSTIEPRSGHRFIGAGMDETRIVADGARIVFDARGETDLTFAHMSISGATGNAGCKPQCGSGLTGGGDMFVDSVRFHGNRNHGMGGTEEGTVITDSVFDNNGSQAFTGCCAGGIKAADGYTIRDSLIHSNVGNGIWCDSGCSGRFVATGNTVRDNTRDGIRYEVSEGPAVIRENVVIGNNTAGLRGGHGGIAIVGSDDIIVSGNTLEDNGHAGIVVIHTPRGRSNDVLVRGNVLNADEIRCDRDPNVECEDNRVSSLL
jgi:parallel beta-helix repeat protein